MAETKENGGEKNGGIELGTFAVGNVNEGGAEIRLTDERKGGTLVLYKQKSLASELVKGRTGRLVFIPDAVPEVEMLTVQMPADETAGLTANAKVIDTGSTEKVEKAAKK